MIAGFFSVSSFIQQFPIMINKAEPLTIFLRFVPQAFRIIAVLLNPSLPLNPDLLVPAVVNVPPGSLRSFFCQYTSLSAISKLFFRSVFLQRNQLVFLVVMVVGSSLCVLFAEPVARCVIGILGGCPVPCLLRQLAAEIIPIEIFTEKRTLS